MRLLLTLVTTAGTYRHTDGPPVDLTGPDGVTSYKAGLVIDAAALDVVLSEGADLSPRTVACSIPDLGVIEWDAVGVGVLAGIPDDATTLAAASPIVVGRLDELAVDGAVVRFSLVEDPLDDRGLILDDAATVSALTWPRTDTERAAEDPPVAAYVGTDPATSPTVEGAHYPVIIGSPGQGASLRAIGMLIAVAYPAAPALLVETSDSVTSATDHAFVVSAGRIDATTVRRISTDRTGEPMSETASVVIGHDLQGRIVSMISAGTALTSPSEESESWVCLDSGYGIADPYGSGPLRRADRVIRYALDRSTLRVDRRCLGRLEALRGHVVDVGIFSQVGAWEWLSGQVLPSLPVAVTSGPLGLSIWPVILSADPSMVEGVLEVGRNAKVLRDPVADPWAPVTRCTVRYRLDARAGSPRSSVTIAGRRRPTDPSTLPISLWAARAWAAVGERSETIDAPWTANDATAMLLAHHRIDATCRPSWTVVVAVPERDAPEVGALVRLIHRDLAIDAVAQVAALSYSGGTAQITLRWRARLGRPE
jgi:hypothetical protein